MATFNTNDYLTTTQAALRLEITVDAVKQYCHRGKLQAMKVGRQWMISKKEIERYSKEQSGKIGRPKTISEK